MQCLSAAEPVKVPIQTLNADGYDPGSGDRGGPGQFRLRATPCELRLMGLRLVFFPVSCGQCLFWPRPPSFSDRNQTPPDFTRCGARSESRGHGGRPRKVILKTTCLVVEASGPVESRFGRAGTVSISLRFNPVFGPPRSGCRGFPSTLPIPSQQNRSKVGDTFGGQQDVVLPPPSPPPPSSSALTCGTGWALSCLKRSVINIEPQVLHDL